MRDVVVMLGGAGGPSEFAGGVAARVSGDIAVTPGQTLYVEVGGNGHSAGLGGFNGGGDGGGIGAGGGGGGSDVRTSPMAAGLTPDHRLIVAGGGGGTGGNGEISLGGVGGAAGSNGADTTTGNPGGGAGTGEKGGVGGAGFFGTGGNGELGLGGAGGASEISGGPGGGGGGGYYGGGGGGGAISGGGGGGGGSSLIPAGGKLELASLTTEPQIEIVYTSPTSTGLPANVLIPPNTVLGFHPAKTVKTSKKKVKVKFTFSSSVTGTTFKCKLDKGAFVSCKSPKSYKVKPGKHKFSVEAVSAGGTDPSPATFSFRVKKKTKS